MTAIGDRPQYDDVTFKFLEINKCLFQARKYFIRDIIPKIEGDPESYINIITQLGGKTHQTEGTISNTFVGPISIDSNCYAEFTIKEKFSKTDINEITKTVKLICQSEWAQLNPEKIEKSQSILLKFYRIFKRSIQT